jgi:RimJ/RimL family protein N-acetyltransferase
MSCREPLFAKNVAGSKARVSVYLTPSRTGAGLGTALLWAGTEWLERERPQVESIEGEIMPTNGASERAFEAVGFVRHRSTFRFCR